MHPAFHVGAAQEAFERTKGYSLNFQTRRCPLLRLSPATDVRGAFFVKITIAIVSCTRQKETFAARASNE